jgi:hypothetical protein
LKSRRRDIFKNGSVIRTMRSVRKNLLFCPEQV